MYKKVGGSIKSIKSSKSVKILNKRIQDYSVADYPQYQYPQYPQNTQLLSQKPQKYLSWREQSLLKSQGKASSPILDRLSKIFGTKNPKNKSLWAKYRNPFIYPFKFLKPPKKAPKNVSHAGGYIIKTIKNTY